MKYTVKTLLKKGHSQRAISRELGISRKTVKKYFDEFQNNEQVLTPHIKKGSKPDRFREQIKDWLAQGLTGVLIQEKLLKDQQFKVGQATISRFLAQFKSSEVYIPLIAKPGEEAQVDFGYLGRFLKDGKMIKIWCFSMVLSHSRYSYHCLVTNQSVSTFINGHIHAFQYFGGVPATVKTDNLKAGVITPNFYEPTIQRQYAEFLQYYRCAPITVRVRRGQDKGKVEAGVKYVKNNFLKRVNHKDYNRLEKDLFEWTSQTCNTRLHGTIKKVPLELFNQIEKKSLTALPQTRYQILKIEHRKVNKYAHISFKNNFYSVPYQYMDKTLTVKSSDTLLEIYDDLKQIAIHQICEKNGEFITREEHKPPEKQIKSEQILFQKAIAFRAETYDFLQEVKKEKPYNWKTMIKGVFSLQNKYAIETINLACKRALSYHALSYSSINNICKNNRSDTPMESLSINASKGFSHDLKNYDQLSNN